ncbi:MAG: ATP-binding protein [Termitinemataceae bacterium]|nr:MAG: ATP-binding protein [Termitinemataceae bacterium]
MQYYQRLLNNLIFETAKTRPLIYLGGPRQTGKSTLAQNLKINKKLNYITFDSPVTLQAANSDPENFIKTLPSDALNIIDEVQMAPGIFPYLKMAVDESRIKDKNKCLYLLTGSANIMALPEMAQALVGRMSILTLLPFSSAESHKKNVNFIDKLFMEKLEYKKFKHYGIVSVIKNATFPELAINKDINSTQWFDDYITTLIQRDIHTITDIRRPEKIITLLSLLALRAGSLLNNINISSEAGLDTKTYERYKAACSNMHIIFEVKPWSKPIRINKRLTKSHKLYFTDTNLLAYLMRRDIDTIYKSDPVTMGHLFENFVACEVMKNIAGKYEYDVTFFRTQDNKEVDFVVEKHNGDAIGIEVKLSGTVSNDDMSNLKLLQESLGSKFKKGIVLYTGSEIVSLAQDIWALPLSFLWE